MSTTSKNSYVTYHTIIIGMGAAGAVAAAKLAKAKKSVLVLEATKCWGGRIMSVPVEEGIVEPGAEWVYGTENNVVYEEATSQGLELQPHEMEFEVYRANGENADHALLNELVSYCIDTQFLDTPRVRKPYPEFVNQLMQDYIKQYKSSNTDLQNNKDLFNDLLTFTNASVCCHKGCNDWSELSAFSDYEDLDGPKHLSWHKLGFSTFFDIVLNKYKGGSGYSSLEILYRKEVVHIKWPTNPKAQVEVKCKDGTAYYSQHVIVTVPLGVLKEKHMTLFEPSLPISKVNAINTIGMGTFDKITFIFPFQWWTGDQDDQMAFFWDSKSRAKVPPEDQWMLKIVKATVPLGVAHAITLWIGGDAAKAMERLADDVVKNKCMNILRWFIGFETDVPEPIRVIRSAWFSNPFTRGSDSFEHIDELPHARQILAEPLVDKSGVPRVLFAGEATHPTHYSSVHGAASSGIREAARLMHQPQSTLCQIM